MIFSVSIDGIQWTLDFAPDSVTIAVIDLVQNITISSQEVPLAAWQLLLSQKARLPGESSTTSFNRSEPRGNNGDERRSTLQCGAQNLETSSYKVSDLEDIDLNRENSLLGMDAVLRPGIDTCFSPATFDDLSMKGSVKNPIVLDKEEDKENAPPPP